MFSLVLLLMSVEPAAKPAAPPASDMAILYFMAGDLRRAVDTARAGMKTDAVKCKALFPMLVEYEFLVPRRDSLTVAEAKAFLGWDKKISPQARGKLTEIVVKRYVDTPLHYARNALGGSDLAKAKQLVGDVLEIDPGNADALALKAELQPDAGK